MAESCASCNEIVCSGPANTPLTPRRMNFSFTPVQANPSRVTGRGMSANDAGAGAGAGAGGRYNAEPSNKERGRPIKEDAGAVMALGMPNSSPAIHAPGETSTPTSKKKRRGRPLGSKSRPKTQDNGHHRPPGVLPCKDESKKLTKSQLNKDFCKCPDATDKPAIPKARDSGLTMHVLIVEAGQDVHNAVKSFVERNGNSFCILTAHGEIFTVALLLANSTVPLNLQGKFRIMSLTGTSLQVDDRTVLKREMSLHLVLSNEIGSVIGGAVAGSMKAASRVKVILLNFIPSTTYNPIIFSLEPLSLVVGI